MVAALSIAVHDAHPTSIPLPIIKVQTPKLGGVKDYNLRIEKVGFEDHRVIARFKKERQELSCLLISG